MDYQIQVDSVYTDFSKAFDKINHNILIAKLAEIGVHGDFLKWFTSYVYNRSQIVTINGYKSSPYVVTSGVPQGSHLGPLLFLIYINDIHSCFKFCQFLIYADDLKIYSQINNIANCTSFQEDLDLFLQILFKKQTILKSRKVSPRLFYA